MLEFRTRVAGRVDCVSDLRRVSVHFRLQCLSRLLREQRLEKGKRKGSKPPTTTEKDSRFSSSPPTTAAATPIAAVL